MPAASPTGDTAPLRLLAGAARTVGAAQLRSAGVALGDRPPLPADLVGRVARAAGLWYAGPGHAASVAAVAADPAVDAALRRTDPATASAVTALGLPAEALLLLGGDDRQLPSGGRNCYGMPVADVVPRAMLSSCTATPPDGPMLDHVRGWQAAVLDRLLDGAALSPARLHHETATRLAALAGLPRWWADRIVLSPSGTDVEALLTAMVTATSSRPLLNVLVGAREAGSGSRAAAAGRWFRDRAGFAPTRAGEPIDGLDHERVRTLDVDVRDALGRPRRAFDVEAEIDAHLRAALDDGLDVLVHVNEGSKTELRQPTLGWVRDTLAEFPGRVRVVVDAAQGRIGAERLRAFVSAGASVFLTGSKALSGPPFCAALFLDAQLYGELQLVDRLPAGLAAAASAGDLPGGLSGLAAGFPAVNLGLHARWAAALAEAEQLRAHPEADRVTVTETLLGALRRELAALPQVHVLPDPAADVTILSFLVRTGSGTWYGREALGDVYRDVLAAGVYLGQPVEIVAGRAAALRVAVGAAAVNRMLTAGRSVADTARQVAGATAEALAAALPALPPDDPGLVRSSVRYGARWH